MSTPRAPIHPVHAAPMLFAHMVLQTSRYEELKAWYQTVLCAHVVHEGQGLCFLTYDNEHHRIAIRSLPGIPDRDPGACGVHHVAYTHHGLPELLGTYRRLEQQGIVPWWPINHGPTISLYYRDPDGNRVEFQVDNFSTKEEAASFFEGEEFAGNPIGVLIDPEALIRDYEAGVPMEDLIRRPPLPSGATPADMRPRS